MKKNEYKFSSDVNYFQSWKEKYFCFSIIPFLLLFFGISILIAFSAPILLVLRTLFVFILMIIIAIYFLLVGLSIRPFLLDTNGLIPTRVSLKHVDKWKEQITFSEIYTITRMSTTPNHLLYEFRIITNDGVIGFVSSDHLAQHSNISTKKIKQLYKIMMGLSKKKGWQEIILSIDDERKRNVH